MIFQGWPRPAGGSQLKSAQKALRALLLLVQYAMAQQDIRYYLNGMLLVLEGNKLKAVATDGHRLAYATMNSAEAGAAEVILPRKAVLELIKLLGDTDDEVDFELDANQVRFRIRRFELDDQGGRRQVSRLRPGHSDQLQEDFRIERARLAAGAAARGHPVERKIPRRALDAHRRQPAHLLHEHRAGGGAEELEIGYRAKRSTSVST